MNSPVARAEGRTHVLAYFLASLVGFAFFADCMATVPKPRAVPPRSMYDGFSYGFFGGVGVAIILRFILYRLTLHYQKMWREHDETFASSLAPARKSSVATLSSNRSVRMPNLYSRQTLMESYTTIQAAVKEEELSVVAEHIAATPDTDGSVGIPADGASSDSAGTAPPPDAPLSAAATAKEKSVRVYDSVVKPLRWYPTLFIFFVLPQILVTIADDTVSTTYNQELARVILHIFVPFRGFALSLVFFANNKVIAHPRALLERLRARYSAFSSKDGSAVVAPLSEPLLPRVCPDPVVIISLFIFLVFAHNPR